MTNPHPRTTYLDDQDLDAAAGAGNEAYFVKVNSETTTQTDSATMPGMQKFSNITLKRG